MRTPQYKNAAAIKRIQEAASSWQLLWAINNQFGDSPDGAVERDICAAEDRMNRAISELKH